MGINFKDTRANLEQANQVVRDLERLLKEQEALISGAPLLTVEALMCVLAR
jgi:hypothetical protein